MNGGLNHENVLEYFSLSPFWDPNSNNATLKMQTNFNALEADGSKLKNMVGVEFEVVKEQYPSLFIIQKQRRKSPTEAFPIAIYYIVNGNIYQSPNLYSILANRMLTIVSHLNRAFRDVYNFVQFHPSSGYRYKVNLIKSEEDENKSVDNDSAMHLRVFQDSVNRVFMNEAKLKYASKQTSVSTVLPTLKLISTKEALSQVTVELEKNAPANTSVSTPSIDGGKSKRKSDKDGTKKKKKAKTEIAS